MSDTLIKFASRRAHRVTLMALTATAAVGICAQANAAAITSKWQAASSAYTGLFSASSHWDHGVPNNNDGLGNTYTAYFDNSGQTYTVNFDAAYTSSALTLYSGNVTFDLDSTHHYIYTAGVASADQTRVTNATWTISNGTVASKAAYVGISGSTSTSAKVLLSGSKAKWTAANGLQIGYNSPGTVYISSSATVSNGSGSSLVLGTTDGGVGILNIDGAGSNFSNTYLAYIGYTNTGTGAVNVTNGGTLSTGILSLARQSTNTGSLTVTGSGSTSTTINYIGIGGYTDGGSTNTDGGTATLKVVNGGSISGSGMVIFDGASVTLASGTITATSGTKTVDATRGGTFDISKLSNTINGNLTLGSTTDTTFHLASDSDYGNLKVTQTLTAAGTLDVVLDGVYTPSNGDIYDLFDGGTNTNPTFSGTFSTVNLPTLAAGLSWDQSNLYTTGIIAVVPEPAALSLLAIGGLLALRRRRSC